MKAPRLLYDLLYSHLIASYIVGIFCAWEAGGRSLMGVAEGAFLIFLCPIILPLMILMSVETLAQGVAVGACYLIILLVACILLAQSRRRRDQKLMKRFETVPPSPVVALDYFSVSTPPAEPFSNLDIVAALSTIATIASLIIYFAVGFGGGGIPFPGVSFYFMCMPMLAAIIMGLARAFGTKPHTLPRRVAVIAICVGLVGLGLMLFTRIPD
jgi:hypothetical protein